MMFFATLIILGLANLGLGQDCHTDVGDACSSVGETIDHCAANYSSVNHVISNLQKYTAVHLDLNWKYLLMSAYFNNYEANREGFSKLYRKLADDAWEDTLDLIKYLAKRGFNMDYNFILKEEEGDKDAVKPSYRMTELGSLAHALDMQKFLAMTAHKIHSEVTLHKENHHDAEVTLHKENHHDAETINFLETKFVSKHADVIRDLSGYANDLHQLIKANYEPSLALYLFDEHLKKVVG